jgi:DNA primase
VISAASIQEVMSRTDIIDVVGQFVRLKKRGANFIANCPFHNEKTPSFYVSASKGIYKCFGCGKAGNAVGFIQEHEKLSYPDAIRWLADFYKIKLEETERSPEQMQQQQAEESLRILNEYASQYFADNLIKTEEGEAVGLSYFKQRGFRKDSIEKFRLGYCSENGDTFYHAAIAKGYRAELLERAGLVKNRQGIYHDVYKGRVIFPIQSMTGRILGFGARLLKSNDRAPKYINTPENEIYLKSKILYGLYQSRQSISKKDECYLVEGYTDVISLHQGGVENVVASSGTSLTEDQLRLIAQLTKNLTILYDGDAAGKKAALRGLDMALGQSFNVKLVLLPEGEDPDSFMQKSGSARFTEFIDSHKRDVIGFRLEVGIEEAGNDPVKRSKLVNEIAESISKINKAEDFSLQGHYIREASRILQVDEAGMVNLVNKNIRERIDLERKQQQREEVKTEAAPILPELADTAGLEDINNEGQDWQLIRVLMQYGEKEYEGYKDVADMIQQHTDLELVENELAKRILEMYFIYRETYSVAPSLQYFVNNADVQVQQKMIGIMQERNEISPKWSINYGIETLNGEMNYVNDVDSSMGYFELKKIKVVQKELAKRLKEEKEPAKVDYLMKKYLELKASENEILRKVNTLIVPVGRRK